jgi:hypothetical protein
MQPSPPFFLVLRLKIANGWPRQAYEKRHSSRRYTHISAEPQPRGLSMVGPRVSPRSYELLQPVACRCWPPHPCHTNRNRVACRWSAPACRHAHTNYCSPWLCRCWPPHPCLTNRNRVACRWSAPACRHVIPQCTLKARWGSPRRHPVRRPAAGPPLNAAANAANIAAERVPCWGTCCAGGPSAGSWSRSAFAACEGYRRARARPTSVSWRVGDHAIGAQRAAARGSRRHPCRPSASRGGASSMALPDTRAP